MQEKALLQHLASLAGPENFFQDRADRLIYAAAPRFGTGSADAALPLAVARPVHSGQLAALVEFCSGAGVPIAISGGRTGLRSPDMAKRPLVVLTTGMGRILEIDAENRVAIVEAGASCARIAAAAGARGLFYPPDPGSREISTIGGNLALNAAGPHALKYGGTGNFVLGLQLMAASGQMFHCHAQSGLPGKIDAGFPMAGLFCGGSGALGIICRATLRLLPRPLERRCLRAAFADALQAAEASAALIASRLSPAALELVSEDSPASSGNDGSAGLLLEFDGHPAEVEASMAEATAILGQCGSVSMSDVRQGQECELFWAARNRLLPAAAARGKPFMLETVCCPPARLPALIEGVAGICRSRGLEKSIFGHAGIARLHVALFYGNDAVKARDAAREIFTLELILNNRLDSEEDAGLARSQWQGRKAQLAVFSNRLRDVFDPSGLFSPQPLPGTWPEMAQSEDVFTSVF